MQRKMIKRKKMFSICVVCVIPKVNPKRKQNPDPRMHHLKARNKEIYVNEGV